MIVIPAIDIIHGQCVRLRHGRLEEKTVYSHSPISMAQEWVESGAERIHIIDLDGAFLGEPQNFKIIRTIKKKFNVFIQMGGGIRSLGWIEKAIVAGIDRIILGTVVFLDPQLTETMFKTFGDRIAVALDVQGKNVAIKGWKDKAKLSIEEALRSIERLGCKEIIFTDIDRDGVLEGVNVKSIQKVMAQTSMTVFASGGVTSMMDIEKLKQINSPGCVIGKALYDGRIRLEEAIRSAIT